MKVIHDKEEGNTKTERTEVVQEKEEETRVKKNKWRRKHESDIEKQNKATQERTFYVIPSES